jgi:tetratricopeptide (TPR) repeat protein
MHWLELTLKIAFTLAMGYFLVSNLIALRKLQMIDPAQLKAAEQAVKANNIPMARAELDKYLNANQKSVDAYAEVIHFCVSNKRPDLLDDYVARATQDTRTAVDPERAVLYSTIAAAYLEIGKGKADQAVAAAEQAQHLAPDSVEARNSLAYTLAETTGDPEKLKQAHDLIVGALTTLNGQVGGTERQLQLALCEDTYGWVLYQQALHGPPGAAAANDARAVDALVQALNDVPDGTPDGVLKYIYYHLGAAYARLDRTEEARNALQVALHFDPENEAIKKELQALPPVAAVPPDPSKPIASGEAKAANPAPAGTFTPLQSAGAVSNAGAPQKR